MNIINEPAQRPGRTSHWPAAARRRSSARPRPGSRACSRPRSRDPHPGGVALPAAGRAPLARFSRSSRPCSIARGPELGWPPMTPLQGARRRVRAWPQACFVRLAARQRQRVHGSAPTAGRPCPRDRLRADPQAPLTRQLRPRSRSNRRFVQVRGSAAPPGGASVGPWVAWCSPSCWPSCSQPSRRSAFPRPSLNCDKGDPDDWSRRAPVEYPREGPCGESGVGSSRSPVTVHATGIAKSDPFRPGRRLRGGLDGAGGQRGRLP